MKNMATELGIILIGYFTLVPAIQVRPATLRPCAPGAGRPVQQLPTGSPAPARLCL